MTQNTIENKQRFFALYIGQDVLKGNAKNHDKHTVTTTLLSNDWLSGKTCLELRSIFQITDEEAIEVSRLAGWRVANVIAGREIIRKMNSEDGSCTPLEILSIMDYLRSRGFLLPFMDLSVEQILAYGWAQVKTS